MVTKKTHRWHQKNNAKKKTSLKHEGTPKKTWYTPKLTRRARQKNMRDTSNEIHTQQLEYQMTIKEKRTKPTQKKITKKCVWKHDIHTKNTSWIQQKNTSGTTTGNTKMNTLKNRDCNSGNSMINETFAQLHTHAHTHLIAPSIFIYERPSPSRPITHWVSSQKGLLTLEASPSGRWKRLLVDEPIAGA